MAIFLLDTTVIVDAINGKRDRHRFLDELLVQRNLLACCSINVTEVYAGMRPHEAKVTGAFLRSLKFYEVTWDIARRAGELKNEWVKKGRTRALPDITIAAVVLANSLTLVTGNRKHFPIPEFQLLVARARRITPRQPSRSRVMKRCPNGRSPRNSCLMPLDKWTVR